MSSNVKSIRQALHPAFLKQPPESKEVELFKKEFAALLDRVKPGESEEFHKNLVIDFLNSVYYKDKHYINTQGKNDMVIHNGSDAASSVGVLVEAKSPTNKAEMVRHDNLNVKSFQELVLYYLRERKTGKNFELRHLIVTNVYEWFVFDAQDFERLFYQNKALLSHFEQFQANRLAGSKTDFFYKEIVSPEIEKLRAEIPYAHFDIRDYEETLRSAGKEGDQKLADLHKFLSPVHLLKLPFAPDRNQLNKEFYAELLHIIGLEEVKQDNKKVIVRKKEHERDSGSIVENAISAIDSMDKLGNADPEQREKSKQEHLFDVAFSLAITWVNRVLFLKLLEAQIIKYHNGDTNFSFLSISKITDYGELNSLFFSVLARKQNEREESIRANFAHVPYLNSSLFEETETEKKTIAIIGLQNNAKIKLYHKTVVRGDTSDMRSLEYLLRFLDGYDFSGEASADTREESKPLISASVLGLIFEKINGYKDGSFFTPSFITMYMCRETISRAVIQKFNEAKGWSCQTITELHNKIEDIAEANKIFSSIRICDPAVGSGHFLVSALNEMVYLKAELGILTDKGGRRLKDYRVSIDNDELIITDSENSYFAYNPKSTESQRVQETFFREKQAIIENCLFGVDINHNAVKICQLRLWIELLKHAYYRPETSELETLPNIDINIKCGNSLISRFALSDKYNVPGLEVKIKNATKKYKEQVFLYKRTDDKATKKQITKNIEEEKSFFYRINNVKDVDYQNWQKAKSEFTVHMSKFNFSATESDEFNSKTAELAQKVEELEEKYNKKIRSCFEWRFELPEVLDDNGNFIGFDAVVGNPPYIQLQSMGSTTDIYKKMSYQVFERTGDIYCH
ncbi:MAG: class I SAM-dependent DNA methyltransferase [Prevotellaceae bacterium]|jgi:hypothetical protein|nr:class I SAM-dependent DNA methyltransferase [Prevotellaceae bacterium]